MKNHDVVVEAHCVGRMLLAKWLICSVRDGPAVRLMGLLLARKKMSLKLL